MNRTRREWLRKKNSGTYRRKIKQIRDLLRSASRNPAANIPTAPSPTSSSTSNDSVAILPSSSNSSITSKEAQHYGLSSDSDLDITKHAEVNDDHSERAGDGQFAAFLRGWAIDFNVPQNSLKPLIREINATFGARLPQDPRTLLRMSYIFNLFPPFYNFIALVYLFSNRYTSQRINGNKRHCWRAICSHGIRSGTP